MEDEILTKDKSDDGTALEKQSYENLLNRAVSDVFNQYDSDGKKNFSLLWTILFSCFERPFDTYICFLISSTLR